MEDLRARLRDIVAAMKFLSPTAFCFAGHTFQQADAGSAVTQLQEQLYHHCYCHLFRGVLEAEPFQPERQGSLLDELSAANAGRSRWDTGWQIHHVSPSGWICANKHGLNQTFAPGEYATYGGPGLGPQPGATVDVFFARESRNMQEGFYFAFGETTADEDDRFDLLRFYWHIHDDGAATLVRSATSALNRFQVPFRLKCLSDRRLFSRLDAAVIFVPRRYYQIASVLLAEIHARLAGLVGAEIPLFTKQLAPGLGLAEDPGNGESFGMNRCRLLAEALADDRVRALDSEHDCLEELDTVFRTHGLSVNAAYLNPGSVDQYEFPDHLD